RLDEADRAASATIKRANSPLAAHRSRLLLISSWHPLRQEESSSGDQGDSATPDGGDQFARLSTVYHFQRVDLAASVAMARPSVPGSCLTGTSARARLRRGWGRQDVLGSKAPGTGTTETVRGVPLAQRFQRAKSFELSSSLVRDGPARTGEVVTHRLAVVPPPAELSGQRA